MAHTKARWIIATALTIGSVGGAYAQGTADSITNRGTGTERNGTSGGRRQLERA